MSDRIYAGLTRGQLVQSIHTESDASAGLYTRSNQQIIQFDKEHVERYQMFRNPFIHARTPSDWVVGLVIAAVAAVITSTVLILLTR